MGPVIKTVHHRTCKLEISKADLERMMQDYAMQLVGFQPVATRVHVKFEDHMEGGSLPYKAGTKCIIEMVEDQDMLPQPDHL